MASELNCAGIRPDIKSARGLSQIWPGRWGSEMACRSLLAGTLAAAIAGSLFVEPPIAAGRLLSRSTGTPSFAAPSVAAHAVIVRPDPAPPGNDPTGNGPPGQ